MEKRVIRTFEEAEEYINSTPRFTSKNTMEDTKTFLAKLGNPDKKLRIIHVAGTNGKGSVCAYLRAILEEAGYLVAVFTSPHLVDIRERFVVDGEMITKEEFLRAFLQIYDALDWEALALEGDFCEKAYHPTYFEFLFFIAMILFPEKQPDYCILETGLGGRLDATNSVSEKELSVITHLSLEHTEYLGDTLEKIAGEKGGIIPENTPVVFWDTCEETTKVLKQIANEKNAACYAVSDRDYKTIAFTNKSIDFSIFSRYYNYISLSVRTIASYQVENATLAVRAIEVLDGGKTITEDQIARGVAKCFWAGRMEEVLPEVYVDGAHNEDGIRAFLETVRNDGHIGTRTLLFSVVKDKDYERMVERLVESGLFDKVGVAHMRTGRALNLETLEEVFSKYSKCEFHFYEDSITAFHDLVDKRRDGERIYIAGSLYLVGEIKELLEND